jgi:hypothetical protein
MTSIEIDKEAHQILMNYRSKQGILYPDMYSEAIKRMYEIIQNERETRMNRYSSADYEGRGYNCRLK